MDVLKFCALTHTCGLNYFNYKKYDIRNCQNAMAMLVLDHVIIPYLRTSSGHCQYLLLF